MRTARSASCRRPAASSGWTPRVAPRTSLCRVPISASMGKTIRAGRWRSTSTSATAAAPASRPARPRTTSRGWARTRRLMGREMHWLRLERYYETVDASHSGTAGHPLPADALPALQQCALRAGLPGLCGLPHPRRAQRAGVQPLRGDAVLRQQLPVQGPGLQLVPVHAREHPRADELAVQPRRDGARQRRHGEVHLLRAADPRGREPGGAGGARGSRRRGPARLPDRVPRRCDHLRQHQGPRFAAWRRWPRTSAPTGCSTPSSTRSRRCTTSGRSPFTMWKGAEH